MKTLLTNAFFIAVLVLVSACSSGTTTSSEPPDLSGASFTGTIQPNTFNARAVELNFIQTDVTGSPSTLTGTFIVIDFEDCLEGGTIAGTITGTSLSFTVTDNAGGTVSFTGTASNNSIEANFTVASAPAVCGDFSGSISVTR